MSKPHRKAKGPQVLTANRLVDGDVVYWRDETTWVANLSEARVFENEDELSKAEADAQAQVKADKIIDPYAFGVDLSSGTVAPASMRELIRAKGPSIRLDLGKQAEAA
ncbi:MAG: DUF2849 domain-containing protein [Alphaproteobacteria bacterium]|nr:MAG: DUF2849 domain-containing protein [Alphaproteobacteria bacterium]